MLTLSIAISFAFSCNVALNGEKGEIDLILLAGAERWEWEVRHGRLVFVECKAGGCVSDSEINRMISLSERVPGCVVVVATLSANFHADVLPRLIRLRDAINAHILPDGSCSRLMVLTGVELYSFGNLSSAWKNLNDARGAAASSYEQLRNMDSICEITCSANLSTTLT